MDDETWAARAVLRDVVNSGGELPRTTEGDTADVFARGNIRHGQTPRGSEGARERAHADGLAMLCEVPSQAVDAVRPALAMDICNGARDVVFHSRHRAEGVVLRHDGSSLPVLPAATSRQRSTRRVAGSGEREEDIDIHNPLLVRTRGGVASGTEAHSSSGGQRNKDHARFSTGGAD